MGVYRCHGVFMAVYGFLGVYEFLGVCGCIWYECLWVFMGIYGCLGDSAGPWVFMGGMGIYWILWVSMDVYEFL